MGRYGFVVVSFLFAVGCVLEDAAEIDDRAWEVVNGTPVVGYPSAGALVWELVPGRWEFRCTGTLVGCDTVITAAHCVCASHRDCTEVMEPEEFQVFFQHAGFFDVVSVNPVPEHTFPDYGDVAVLRLAEPVSGIRPAPLIQSNPGLTDTMKIVGFGRTEKDVDDGGIKRMGELTREPCGRFDDEEMLCFDPDDSPTVSCSGDSGGPNYIELDGVLHLAGVVSGGGTTDSCVGGQKFAANIAGYLDFVSAHAGELGGSCGEIPDVEAPAALFLGHEGLEVVSEYLVDVPPGTAEVRFTANAMPGEYVLVAASLGETPDPIVNDCDGRGRMAAACRVMSPTPGTWHLVVTSDSEHQATMSVIPGGPIAVPDEYMAVSGRVLRVPAEEGLLINDEAARGGELRAEVVVQPGRGAVIVAEDGSFEYQSERGYLGIDSFTYRAIEDPYSAVTEVEVEVVEAGGCGCRAGGRGALGDLMLLGLALALGLGRRGTRRSV